LTDQIALNLSRESEGESQDFALDIIAQAIAVFDGPHTALLGHADVQDLHDHKEISAQSRELTTDDNIILMDLAQQSAKLSFVVASCTTDSFFYPVVNSQVLSLAELVDFEPLVFNGLFITTHSNVTVNHFIIF